MSANEPGKPLRRRWRLTMGTAGGAVVVIMLAICIGSMPYTFGRVHVADSAEAKGISPRRYEATNPDLAMLPPFWAPHVADETQRVNQFRQTTGETPRPILGTDRLGRSVLARCLAGGAISLTVGLAASAIAVIIGTIYGAISGASGGRTDAVMMRIVDVFFGLPYILLVVLLAVAVDGIIERVDARAVEFQQVAAEAGDETAKGPAVLVFVQKYRALLNVVTLLIAIGAVSWLTLARVIRGQVLSLKQQPFMEACRAIGVPLHRQFFVHLLPNLSGPIIVYATLAMPAAILSESFLSFLGIGVQEPLPSWGNLASAGLSELNIVRPRWWLLVWPCMFIAVGLLALNFVGEGLRQRLDPRLRPQSA